MGDIAPDCNHTDGRPRPSQIGPYRILEKIGAGGMGEVYKAYDTRLRRTVAIKWPSSPFNARLEREARAAAALSHPHICSLFDIGPDYLVMEYVEGKPLAGRVTWQEAVRLGIQIAAALGEAHRHGIVHRDLKPANILLAKSGVKIVDFGLARIESRAPADETQTMDHTVPGAVIGTLPYMSPEQVQGKTVDARCDIFAFGCVLYELLTGRRAFSGENTASLIASILSQEPPLLSVLAPGLPPALEYAVRRCLAKDPEERWQSARDLEAHLRWIQNARETPPRRPGSRAAVVVRAIVIAAIVVAAGLGVWLGRSRSVSTPPRRLLVASEEALACPAISPDGTHVAYIARGTVFIRDLARVDPVEISDSVDSLPSSARDFSCPFWSPDSRWLAYSTRGEIRKVMAEGGASRTVCKTPAAPQGAAWTNAWDPRGDIVFSVNAHGIYRAPADGGEPVPIVDPGPHNMYDFHNLFFVERGPDFLVWGHPGPYQNGEWFLVSELGKRVRPTGIRLPKPQASWAAGGLLVTGEETGGGLWAVGWDRARGAPGEEHTLVDPLGGAGGVSNDGSLVYLRRVPANEQLVLVDRAGHVVQELGQPVPAIASLAVSPDGRRIAFESDSSLWVYDFARNSPTRLMNEVSNVHAPRWHSDGKRLGFTGSSASDSGGLFVQPADSSARPEIWADLPSATWDWSRDGSRIVYATQQRGRSRDILLTTRSGPPVALLSSIFVEDMPEIDPSGNYFAYQSDESGHFEVYVHTFPGGSGRWLASDHGGQYPRWSPGGDELFFLQGEALMAVKVSRKDGLRIEGPPRKLFSAESAALLDMRLFVPVPHSTRFVMARRTGRQHDSIVLVESWRAEIPQGRTR